jgi:hypothetical protein
VTRSIGISYPDLLKFLRREIDHRYPYHAEKGAELENTDRELLIGFVENHQVRAAMREFCTTAISNSHPQEIAASLAALVVVRKPEAPWGDPYAEPYIGRACKILGELIDLYIDEQEEAKPSAREKSGYGRAKDKNVNRRRQLLRQIMNQPTDLSNRAKVLSLFGALEKARIPIPGNSNQSCQWMRLLSEDLRKQELQAALETLRKDFERS